LENTIQTECSPIEIPAFITSSSEEETFTLGKRLSALLEKGSIVALTGRLGAGKTCFVKGIAIGLGISDTVTSPSYTIVSEYEGFLTRTAGNKIRESVLVYHIDAYRLGGNSDFSTIGGEDIIYGDGISLIEWSERIEEFIPEYALRVSIEIEPGNTRKISIFRVLNPEGKL